MWISCFWGRQNGFSIFFFLFLEINWKCGYGECKWQNHRRKKKKEWNQGGWPLPTNWTCLLTPHSSSRTFPFFASNSSTIPIPFLNSYTFVLLCLLTEVLQEAPVNALGFLPELCVEAPQNADPCWSTTQESHNTHKNHTAQEEQIINMKEPKNTRWALPRHLKGTTCPWEGVRTTSLGSLKT